MLPKNRPAMSESSQKSRWGGAGLAAASSEGGNGKPALGGQRTGAGKHMADGGTAQQQTRSACILKGAKCYGFIL